MATAERTEWLSLLENDFWQAYRDAGWVQKVTYRAYDVETDTVQDAADGVGDVEAVVRGEVRQERDAPGGGRVFVVACRVHLRASQLGGVAVSKRGVVETADGREYAVEAADLLAEQTRWQCDCVRL